MRKSLQDLPKSMARKADYPGLPEELANYCYWLADSGTCVMCVPECLLKEHFGSLELWRYEVPVPVRYVLEKGYRLFEEYVVVQADYDKKRGLAIPGEYYEED